MWEQKQKIKSLYKLIALALGYLLVKSFGKWYKAVDGHLIKFLGERSLQLSKVKWITQKQLTVIIKF